MGWQLKSIFWGGICTKCGERIGPNENGWHSFELHRVRCLQCGPPASEPLEEKSGDQFSDLTESAPPVVSEVIQGKPPNPIGGSAALRESQKQRNSSWLKGATGEYLMDKALHQHLDKDAIVLTDRQLPATSSNIDHVVVAPSGVWVIDSKNWEGKIEYKFESSKSSRMRLLVGGEDRTYKVDAIYRQVIPIAQIIGDMSVPIHPAMAFVNSEWSLSSLPRLLMKKPYKHGEVWISPPRILINQINKPGLLGKPVIDQLAQLLDASLPPR